MITAENDIAVPILSHIDKTVLVIIEMHLITIRKYVYKIFKALLVTSYYVLGRDVVTAFSYTVAYAAYAFFCGADANIVQTYIIIFFTGGIDRMQSLSARQCCFLCEIHSFFKTIVYYPYSFFAAPELIAALLCCQAVCIYDNTQIAMFADQHTGQAAFTYAIHTADNCIFLHTIILHT